MDPNVRSKTITFPEDNIGEHLDDPGYVDDFLDIAPKAPIHDRNN